MSMREAGPTALSNAVTCLIWPICFFMSSTRIFEVRSVRWLSTVICFLLSYCPMALIRSLAVREPRSWQLEPSACLAWAMSMKGRVRSNITRSSSDNSSLYKGALLLLLGRFSRVRLCSTPDGSPPGPAIPGILQARALEWVAISFANAWKWKGKVKSLSHVPMGFSRQEYWNGVPLPSPTKEHTTCKRVPTVWPHYRDNDLVHHQYLLGAYFVQSTAPGAGEIQR